MMKLSVYIHSSDAANGKKQVKGDEFNMYAGEGKSRDETAEKTPQERCLLQTGEVAADTTCFDLTKQTQCVLSFALSWTTWWLAMTFGRCVFRQGNAGQPGAGGNITAGVLFLSGIAALFLLPCSTSSSNQPPWAALGVAGAHTGANNCLFHSQPFIQPLQSLSLPSFTPFLGWVRATPSDLTPAPDPGSQIVPSYLQACCQHSRTSYTAPSTDKS
jgi:hypothetical protein